VESFVRFFLMRETYGFSLMSNYHLKVEESQPYTILSEKEANNIARK
jgi:hypothetical protein